MCASRSAAYGQDTARLRNPLRLAQTKFVCQVPLAWGQASSSFHGGIVALALLVILQGTRSLQEFLAALVLLLQKSVFRKLQPCKVLSQAVVPHCLQKWSPSYQMYQGRALSREGYHTHAGLGEGQWKVVCRWMKLGALGKLCPTKPLARKGGFDSTLQRPNLMALRILLSLGQSIRGYKRRVWISRHLPYWDVLWGSQPMVGWDLQR